VPRWTALLFFLFAPTLAARWLASSRVACAFPLLVAACIALALLGAGVETGDALATSLTFLRYSYGLAVGGALLSVVGTRLIGRTASVWDVFGPASAAAGWLPFAFVGFLGLAHLAGAGATAGLFAGLLLLLWGTAAGIGIIGGDDGGEPGRMLVAICLGLSGCLIGFWGAHSAPPPASVMVLRAPFESGAIRPGSVLLVRSDPAPPASALVLLREAGTREAVFVQLRADGSRIPLGEVTLAPQMLQDWNIAGRVFLRLGGPGVWGVVRAEQTPPAE